MIHKKDRVGAIRAAGQAGRMWGRSATSQPADTICDDEGLYGTGILSESETEVTVTSELHAQVERAKK